jgi:hypothetical protein
MRPFPRPNLSRSPRLSAPDERVREAHRESVRVALDQLERYTQARIGGNHPPETTGRFIAAKFEHDTARPVDGYVAPQLHTHAIVFNVTERDKGQPRAIQPQSLFASQQFATAIYQSELTYRLRHLGYEITTGRSGAPEIKGYTQEYLDVSSPRSQQIREYLERTGRSGKEAAEIAAHSTRDRKEIHSPGEVMAAHRKLAADFGYQAEAVVRAARERSQHQEKPVNSFERVRESLTFSRDKNFEREAVVDERALIRDGLRRGMGEITHVQVFTSQLLCEQVVGRGLRRTSYEVDEVTGLFRPEYVNIFGVPFTFLPHEGSADAPPPPPATGKTRIEPVPERRTQYEMTWPNVIRIDHEYRPQLTLDTEKVKRLVLDAYQTPMIGSVVLTHTEHRCTCLVVLSVVNHRNPPQITYESRMYVWYLV